MSQRAFSLIESLIVASVSALILGVVVSTFGFATKQTSDAFSRITLWTQLNHAADRIEQTIRQARSCTIENSGAAIQCAMPNAGVDLNQDGQWDAYLPTGINASGQATYAQGGYVWYYTTTAPNGAYGTAGSGNSMLWRAIPSSSASPTTADIDASFSQYYGGPFQYDLVSSLSATVNASAHTITYTLSANSAIDQTQQVTNPNPSLQRTLTISRTVAWRNVG